MRILTVLLLAVPALVGPVIAPTVGAWALDQPKQTQEIKSDEKWREQLRRDRALEEQHQKRMDEVRRYEALEEQHRRQRMQEDEDYKRKVDEYNKTDRCCTKLPVSEADRKMAEKREASVRARRLEFEAAQNHPRGAPQEDRQQHGSRK